MRKLFFFFWFVCFAPTLLCAQKTDSITVSKDSIISSPDSLTLNKNLAVQIQLRQNQFLNIKGTPVRRAVNLKKLKSTDWIFYLMAGLVLIMSLIKFFFSRYFTNLFRVFFNTSLRQSQLTDQLLQAKLPSLFFNVFFILSGGIYIYFLLLQYRLIDSQNQFTILTSCIVVLGMVYFVKFCTLKFSGWITGNSDITNTYIFIIFLICKIIGILLIPFIILMVFSSFSIAYTCTLISLLIIGLLLLLRFFRSYGLLQNVLKISKFHFLLYIAGVEILPILLLYKGLLLLLSKNL